MKATDLELLAKRLNQMLQNVKMGTRRYDSILAFLSQELPMTRKPGSSRTRRLRVKRVVVPGIDTSAGGLNVEYKCVATGRMVCGHVTYIEVPRKAQ